MTVLKSSVSTRSEEFKANRAAMAEVVGDLKAKVESELMIVAGIQSQQKFVYGIADQPYLAYQGGGALIAMGWLLEPFD